LAKDRNLEQYSFLKKEYHEISIVLRILYKNLIDLNEKNLKEKTEYSNYFLQIKKIFDDTLTESNPIKNYLKFCRIVNFDTTDYFLRIGEQKDYHAFLFEMMRKNHSMATDKELTNCIKGVLDIYRRFSELAKPLINSLRIAIELSNGIQKPKDNKRYNENCLIIKKAGYYSVINSVEPLIRNSESHFNTEIVKDRIKIFEEKDGVKRVIDEFQINAISLMLHDIDKNFFPAMAICISIIESTLLIRMVHSDEYISLLLEIDNSAMQ
jgi:hypothetical protein